MSTEARLLRSWELKGGISATMTVLEFERTPRQLDRVVVRELKWGGLAARQQALEREFKTLQTIVAFGLPAPRPYCIDDAGQPGRARAAARAVEPLPDLRAQAWARRRGKWRGRFGRFIG